MLVAAGMVAANPGALAAAAAGLDGVQAWFEVKADKHPDLKTLEKEVAGELKRRLKAPDFHCPRGAEVHLPQMIEAAMAGDVDFVGCNLEAERIVEVMVGRFKEVEHRNPAMVEAYRCLYLPVLRGLMDDPRMLAVLDPMIKRKQLAQGDNIAAKLDQLATLPREQLELLATRFGIEDAFDLGEREIQEQLALKAREYRDYRKLIDNIDERVAGLGNLKAAAKEAAERLDFDEVEALMARVDEVETEIAAEAKEIRAANALLRGRVEQAYGIYCAAADSFASVDRLEPARRRARYFKPLYEHGLTFAGPGLGRAVEMLQDVLRVIDRAADGALWAGTQNNLGAALQALGARASDPGRLQEAVAAFRQALKEFTREAVPLQWAMTQNNLGNALQALGARAGDPGQLQEAVAAYREALKEYTRAAVPLQWAKTQNNLGAALRALGVREGDAGRLQEAVAAFREALKEFTREAVPLDWAGTQNNLAGVELAFFDLDGEEAHLAQAVGYLAEAREVFEDAGADGYLAIVANLEAHIAARRGE